MPPKNLINRDALVQRALALADDEGIDAVTIRRLAQDFSVTPMALYWHVKNKDELLAAMGDALFDGLVIPDATGSWVDQLRELMVGLVEALRSHPASVDLAYPRILQCENGRRLTEYALGILLGAGFSVYTSSDLARHALHTAVMLVNGEPGAERAVPADERKATMNAKRQALALLSPERFPNIVACADALTGCDDVPGYYLDGVDLFISGVAALASRVATSAP